MKEYAVELGTSVPTIYRKLKDAGIDIKGLRDANTGDLTPSGAATIASLFDGPRAPLEASQDVLGSPSQTFSRDSSQYVSGDMELRIEVEVLRIKLEGMQNTVEMLRAALDRQRTETERLRDEKDRLLTMLEQQLEQQQRLLPDPDGQRQRRGLFRRR